MPLTCAAILSTTGTLTTIAHSHRAGQRNDELGELAEAAIHSQCPPVLFDNDIVAERQAEPRALASRFGGEERL